MTDHTHLEPGQQCPTCERRVPYPKTEASPKTRTVAKRVPVDEFDAHEDVAEAAAKHLGVHGRPYWRFWLDTYAYAYLLQDEGMKGFANRGPQ